MPFVNLRIPTPRQRCFVTARQRRSLSPAAIASLVTTRPGKELWRANGLNPENNPMYRIVASPIIFDEIIYAPTRVKPLLALKAGGRGDITSSCCGPR